MRASRREVGDGGVLGGMVTAVILRGTDLGEASTSYEVGWVADGQAHRDVFEHWRVTAKN